MKLLIQCLAVGIAGFFGAIAPLVIGRLSARWFPLFPVGTLVVNLTGALLLGWFYEFTRVRLDVSETMKRTVMIGFIGTYTTFSTWVFESDRMIRQDAWLQATANLAGSVFLGLIAV